MRAATRRLPFFAIAIIAVLVGWVAISYSSDLAAQYVLPRPPKVLSALRSMMETNALWLDILASLRRIFLGFLIAALSAIPLGILLGRFKTLYLICEPAIEVVRPISPIAWIPLSILWFGLGEESKIFIVWLLSFFFILVNTVSGVMGVDKGLVQAAQTLGASERMIFSRVILQAALPSIITGLRLGLGVSFGVVVIAEMIGARSGIGYMMERARAVLDPSQVLIGMATLGVLGYFFNQLLPMAEARLLRHRRTIQRE